MTKRAPRACFADVEGMMCEVRGTYLPHDDHGQTKARRNNPEEGYIPRNVRNYDIDWENLHRKGLLQVAEFVNNDTLLKEVEIIPLEGENKRHVYQEDHVLIQADLVPSKIRERWKKISGKGWHPRLTISGQFKAYGYKDGSKEGGWDLGIQAVQDIHMTLTWRDDAGKDHHAVYEGDRVVEEV